MKFHPWPKKYPRFCDGNCGEIVYEDKYYGRCLSCYTIKLANDSFDRVLKELDKRNMTGKF